MTTGTPPQQWHLQARPIPIGGVEFVPVDTPVPLTEVEWLRGEVTRLNGQVERLVAQVVEMKREGFARPPESGTVDTSQDLPQAVLDAIEERSPSPSSAVAQSLATWARRQLRGGAPEDAVAGSILRGTDFEVEGAEVTPAERVED